MRNIKYILIFFVTLVLSQANAQFWETTQGDSLPNVYNTALLAPDESLFSAGYTVDAITNKKNLWLTKTNSTGLLEWETIQAIPDISLTARSIIVNNSGNLLVFGSWADTLLRKGVAWEVNPAGQSQNLWNNFPDDHSINDVEHTNDGGYIVSGQFGLPGAFNTDAYVARLNNNFDGFDWIHYYGGNTLESDSDLLQLSTGNYAFTGYTASFGNGAIDVFLILFDNQGNIQLERTYGTEHSEIPYSFIEFDQKLWFTGQIDLGQGNDQDIFVLNTSLSGDSLNYWIDERPGLQVGRSIDADSNRNLFITGETRIDGAPFQLLLQKWDTSGAVIWSNDFGGPLSDNGKAIQIADSDNIYIVGGYTQLLDADIDGYIIHPNTAGVTYTASVNGQVYWDENESCLNENEISLENWLVEIQNGTSQWTTTNALGNYNFNVDNGNYQVIVYPPNDYWNPCDISIPVLVQSQMDTIDLSHGIKSATACPLLIVDIGTSFLRRCFENTYQVKVCNQGTSVATAANTVVELDPSFTFISSTIPGTTVDDQNYDFDLGDIAPLNCVEFEITILLDCDSTVIGQTHCVEAHAYPDSICNPINAIWDNSSIEVDAVCLGDSVEFIISNTGTGSTQSPLEYIITEDHIMLYQGGFDLDPGTDTLIRVPADGGTLRMAADQAPGHPGMSMPSVAVEGCGGFPFSLGFVIQYPHNDGNPFVDIDCRENVGSYDPNDKQAFPAGYRDEHFIDPNTQLEYLIRFQNTGTDTAFTVVIRDTIDANLDLSSISLGSASHAYRWNVLGENILEVRFNNIQLPDSTTNEQGSHGFVKFTIDQKTDLLPASMIFNQAAIYFDFNPPIITNQTYHTIGIDYIIIDLVDGQNNPQEQTAIIEYYPNPFLEQINFELINIPSGELNFQLFNAQGQLIHIQKIDSNRFSYYHKDRSPGVYFFQITDDRQILKTGKIIHLN